MLRGGNVVIFSVSINHVNKGTIFPQSLKLKGNKVTSVISIFTATLLSHQKKGGCAEWLNRINRRSRYFT